MSKKTEASGLRLAELISALAFATDLARGQLMEHELHSCLLAVHLGEIVLQLVEQIGPELFVLRSSLWSC